MQVRVLTEHDKENWNLFLTSRPDSQILQSYEWGQFKASSSWEHFIVAVEEGSRITAGISILSRKMPGIKKTFFYAPRGPIYDLDRPELFDKLMDGVCVEAAVKNSLALKIDPEIEEGTVALEAQLKKKGFIKKKKQVQPRATYFIDLGASLDELLKSFEEKTRYNIRLAEKKGVTVIEESNLLGVENFYRIYKETCKRDEFLIHPKSYYLRLLEMFVEKGNANIFTAMYQGNAVASIFTFNFGDRVWYMYGASSNEARNVMPNHALHWHFIKWAKEKGFRVYDMWGVPVSSDPKHPLHGVWRFKKGFNGKLHKWTGVWDLPFDKLSYHLFDKGTPIYQALRSLLTKGRIVDSLSE